MGTRWQKVFTDLWSNKVRTLLVVLSIAVGVFAVGFVSTTFIILLGDMDADYQSVNPYSALIILEDTFDEDFAKSLEKVPGVAEVEGRSSLIGRVSIGPEKKATFFATAFDSFDEMKIDRIRPNTRGGKGVLDPPGKHEVYIERSAMSALNLKAGDLLPVELEDGRIRELKIREYVYNITSPPYIFTNMVSGYVNTETMEWLGGDKDFNTVYLTVAENKTDEEHVKAVAKEVANKVEKSGRTVYYTFVMEPGRHWATDLTQALGMMMGFLGLLAVFLSAFLVINTINNLLNQQIRQIGVMKAIGGKASQIIIMYIVMVLCFGVLAFLVAVPLSTVLGYATAVPIANILNFNLGDMRLPRESLILQITVALVIPMLAALMPVIRGVRISIREAISDYGIGQAVFNDNWLDRQLEKIKSLSRPLLISLRNTFRRKARLVLTLLTLTLGGAIFIGVFNVRGSITEAVHRTMGYFISDVNISLNKEYRIQQVEPILKSIPGVESIEGWGYASAEVLSDDKDIANDVSIIAPPANSRLINPVMTSGRWLLPDDDRAIVIGNALVKLRPELKVGDEVTIKINRLERVWRIVGIYQIAGTMNRPIVYANNEALTSVVGNPDQFSELRVVTNPHDITTQDRVVKMADTLLAKEGIRVQEATTGISMIQQEQTTIDVLILFLLVMAVLIAIVGGLGLAGTMTMNVMERTREIGVMRSTGASDGTILYMVVIEGMFIGTISWILGIFLAVPITYVLNSVVGMALLNSALPFVLSLDGFIIWLIIVAVLSALASALPARYASRLTIREILAYE